MLVERYGSEYIDAVIPHPDDFAELQGSSQMLDEGSGASDLELTDLGARAHRLAEFPQGDLIEDRASVERLLGV